MKHDAAQRLYVDAEKLDCRFIGLNHLSVMDHAFYQGADRIEDVLAVSKQGEVFAIPQIPEWEHFGLQAYLEKVCSRKVMVMNDINAVAMGYLAGERMNGPYTGEDGKLPVRNLVYLHVEGTGLGAGIIIDGRLYSGCNSFA